MDDATLNRTLGRAELTRKANPRDFVLVNLADIVKAKATGQNVGNSRYYSEGDVAMENFSNGFYDVIATMSRDVGSNRRLSLTLRLPKDFSGEVPRGLWLVSKSGEESHVGLNENLEASLGYEELNEIRLSYC